MGWGGIAEAVISYGKHDGAKDDDWIDRINHHYTMCILIVFAITVSTGQYVGDPIHCWTPDEFTGAYEKYVSHYCWIANTYYIPMEDTIPRDSESRENKEITYYQWVPLILLFQAFLFKFPNIVWSMCNGASGMNVDRICKMTTDTQIGKLETKDKTVADIAYHIDRWLRTHRTFHWTAWARFRVRFSHILCFCFGKRDGTYLTGLYMFVKLLYCVNIVGQFLLLNVFLSINYTMYGFEIIDYLARYGQWRISPRFPRVTLCDFDIRQLNNIQRWTVQCVLPINLFNEKIFIFLWFWLVFVAILTLLNLFKWIHFVLFKHTREVYVRKFLKLSNIMGLNCDKKMAGKFANEYLRDDGVFLLRVVSYNSTDIVVVELVKELWKLYSAETLISAKTPQPRVPSKPKSKPTSNGVDARNKKQPNYRHHSTNW